MSVYIEFVDVPPGKFMMGFPENGREVVIKNKFRISKHPITNAQYGKFLEAMSENGGQYPKPRYWDDPRFNQPEQPVVGVSYYDALCFCGWAGCRLPTSEEWEYAARGPESFTYPWGNDPPTPEHAHYNQDWNTGSTSVVRVFRDGQWVDLFEKGKSWCGAYQMSGNVWEWTSSVYK